MHLADKEYPVWSGYHDGEEWVSADGSTVEGPVLGWLQLEDAAVLLGPKCSLCGQRPARGGKRQGSALCESCYHAD